MLHSVLQTFAFKCTATQHNAGARLFFLYVTDCSVYFIKHSPNGLPEKKRQFCFVISCSRVLIADDNLNLISLRLVCLDLLWTLNLKDNNAFTAKMWFSCRFHTIFFSHAIIAQSKNRHYFDTVEKRTCWSVSGVGYSFCAKHKNKTKEIGIC